MSNTLILIDGGFVCAQARYATGNLESSASDITGVAFGFLARLLYLSKQTGSKNFIFAWDTRESFRKDAYKPYKQMRTARLTPEEYAERVEYYKQVDRLRDELIPMLGFKNCFHQKGVEADDVIAYVTQNTQKPCLIVSADQDLYQLLSDNVSMLIPTAKGRPPKLFTKEDFIIKHRIQPEVWWKAKAIMGCNSDNVEGIRGIGPVNAIKFLRGELKKDSKQYRLIKEQWEIVKRNIGLVKLPHKKTKPIVLQKDKLSYENFLNMCERLEFRSFLEGERSLEWVQLFSDSKSRIRERLNK